MINDLMACAWVVVLPDWVRLRLAAGGLGGELPINLNQFGNSFASLALALIAFPDKELCGRQLSDAKSKRLERCVG